MDFSQAIPLILKHEGGFVDHPSDPGGATNKGVTLSTFRRYIKPNGSVADLKALTTDQAVIVYKRQYWDRVMGDQLPAGVNYAVADFAVNSGPRRAAEFLQRIVNVPPDGRIGPVTLRAVSNTRPEHVINKLCDDRITFMRGIKGGEMWKVFGKGWQRRVDEVRRQSLAWVGTVAQIDTPAQSPWAAFFAALASIFGGKK